MVSILVGSTNTAESTALEVYSLLAFSMKVDPTNASRTLIETDVVEAFKARARDRLDFVIRDEEVLFPAHEDMFALHVVLQ